MAVGRTSFLGRGAGLAWILGIVMVLSVCTRAVAEIPDEAKREFNRGIELTEAKKADSAIAAYEAAIKIAPDYLQAHINAGALYYDKGNLQMAASHLNKAVALDSSNVPALKSLGLVHIKADDYAEAIKVFKLHNAKDDGDAGVWASLALAYSKLEDEDNALAAYKKVVALDPKDYRAWYNIGNIYRKSKDYENAIDAYDQAIQANPKYVDAYYNKAISAHQLDQDTCVPAYEAFLKVARGKSKWKTQVSQVEQIVKQIKDYLDLKGE